MTRKPAAIPAGKATVAHNEPLRHETEQLSAAAPGARTAPDRPISDKPDDHGRVPQATDAPVPTATGQLEPPLIAPLGANVDRASNATLQPGEESTNPTPDQQEKEAHQGAVNSDDVKHRT